jgi:cytosine/adenosine deaminase-related metal-dependent hydrolase
MKFDLVIRGASVVDPKNKVKGRADIGIKQGKVVEVGPGLPGAQSREVIDLNGYTVMPGVVDPHVHCRGTAQRQMVKAGVCTCLDMGAMPQVISEMPDRGCGMNVAGLYRIGPFPQGAPTRQEMAGLVEKALASGALGLKIAGGHFPSTPEAIRMAFEAANEAGAYMACHCGSTRCGSNLEGLLEVIELAGDLHLHVAHVNSYLRGLTRDPVEEVLTGLRALKGKKNLVSESYLAVINGTGASIKDHVTLNCLRKGKYERTDAGLEAAIRDGYCQVHGEIARETVLLSGEEGVGYWKEHGDVTRCSFPVNEPQATFLCAVKKDEQSNFIIDAISTDGGSTPRNVAVEHGLALVRYRALTMEEFVAKTSTAGAAMLGLPDKGHLGHGADADITVLDLERGKPVMTIIGGKVVMAHGVVYGRGGTVLTTARGVKAAEAAGLLYREVNVSDMLIYKKSRS